MKYSKIPKYILHDSSIYNIDIKSSSLKFFIQDGIYLYNGNEIELFKDRKLVIDINNFDCNIYNHITIYKFIRNIRKEISLNKFVKMLTKNRLRIYLDFYSEFADALLMKGFRGKYEVEIIITDINEISVL